MRFIFWLLLCSSAVADIKEDVYYFADDARRGRDTGSQEIKDCRDYIVARLDSLGIQSVLQPAVGCANLVATIPGYQDSIVVIGAHLDHIGVRRNIIKNGADDNASGSAVLLDLASRISKIKPRRTVVLVWFTGEEKGLLGSREYVKQNPRPVLMINLDMVGRLGENLRGNTKGNTIPDRLLRKYPFAKRIGYRNSSVGSDQRSFNSICPTILLHTGIRSKDPVYHTGWDDPETLDYDGLQQISDLAYDLTMFTVGFDYKISKDR